MDDNYDDPNAYWARHIPEPRICHRCGACPFFIPCPYDSSIGVCEDESSWGMHHVEWVRADDDAGCEFN